MQFCLSKDNICDNVTVHGSSEYKVIFNLSSQLSILITIH